jgi:cell cycle checkpoint control protein RAD9A/cell cycle checkpoint control protein RAD9B
MECVIPGRSVKIFAKIIHCLSKVGDELFLEPAADKVPLISVRMNYKSMPGSSVAV